MATPGWRKSLTHFICEQGRCPGIIIDYYDTTHHWTHEFTGSESNCPVMTRLRHPTSPRTPSTSTYQHSRHPITRPTILRFACYLTLIPQPDRAIARPDRSDDGETIIQKPHPLMRALAFAILLLYCNTYVHLLEQQQSQHT